ncbi:MAG: HNH endonuclease [Chloroflexi bacterium]|nr:HNH endonuclease [Chloroflexota bacterium]
MVQVLVLNASYEPLHIVGHRRAIALLLGGKVEVVEPARNGRVVRSARAQFPLPSVIRLRRYVNVPQRGAVWSRQAVLARDRLTCVYCGKQLTPATATIDHVLPQRYCRVHNIPANTWTNTVAACAACQARKCDRLLHESGLKFHDPTFEPRRPRTRYWVLSSEIAPEWRQYIEF